MSIQLASLNASVLSDQSKVARLLRDILSFSVDLLAIQKTRFASFMLVF